MGDWNGTVPTILAGDIPTGDDWKTITDILTAATSAWVDFSTQFKNGIVGTTGPTMGDSTVTAKYNRIGKTFDVAFSIIIGSTFSAGSGNYSFPLPTGFSVASHRRVGGWCYILDTGTADRFGGTIIGRSTGTDFRIGMGTAFVSATSPQTWATGDEIWGGLRGELL